MALTSVFFYLFTALVAVNLIFADNQVEFEEVASRKERSPLDTQERLYSSLITTCNYTATPGATCASCSQAMQCLPNNNGILRICRGFLPYCNNGRCSFIPSATACNSTIVG